MCNVAAVRHSSTMALPFKAICSGGGLSFESERYGIDLYPSHIHHGAGQESSGCPSDLVCKHAAHGFRSLHLAMV